MAKLHPHPVDVQVGRTVRALRVYKGMSHSALAHAVGISFQAVQKYEAGGIRVSASRLVEIAAVLDVPVARMFEDLSDPPTVAAAKGRFDRSALRLAGEIAALPLHCRTAVADIVRMLSLVPEEAVAALRRRGPESTDTIEAEV